MTHSGEDYAITPIGRISSPFRDKFGIPRQPGLTRHVRGFIELLPPYNREEAVRGLEQFSHIWLTFLFHQNLRDNWQPTVRPPRLGGNTKIGVFASRSPFRPNGLGLSVVELESIQQECGRIRLHIRNMDLLDGTPVIDIKPYLPYVDAIPQAKADWAKQAPQNTLSVQFSSIAEQWLNQPQVTSRYPDLIPLLQDVLGQDPRPAYQRPAPGNLARPKETIGREYGITLYDLNIRWRVAGSVVEILSIQCIC